MQITQPIEQIKYNNKKLSEANKVNDVLSDATTTINRRFLQNSPADSVSHAINKKI